MNWFRSVGAMALVWLASGVGCADTADGDVKSGKVVSSTKLDIKVEDSTEKPSAVEPETIEIPLDQIAGFGRGGLRALEPELHIYRDTPEKIKKYSTPEGMKEIRRKMARSLVIPIERAMAALPRGTEAEPQAGFAVRGRDRAALPGVHRVLVQGEKPNNSFSIDEEVSLVFFTHPTTPRVRLDQIVRKGNVVKIHYMLISQGRPSSRWKLVSIPCGKLPSGKYHVEMVRSASKEKEFNQRGFPPVEVGLEDHIVCRSFRFTISDQSSEGSNAETRNHHPE